MNACDTILFDFGHTLVDLVASNDALRKVYGHIRYHLQSVGYESVPTVDEMVATVARRIDEVINDSYRGTSLEELRITDVFDVVYREIGIALQEKDLEHIVVMEHQALSGAMIRANNVKETLLTLKSLGLKLGVVSNMTNLPELMRHDLHRMELLEYFDVTTFSSETGVRKPDPRIYQVTLDSIRSVPSKTIFVGDRIKEDVLGPQALGMRAVLTHQFRQEELNGSRPDRVIRDLTDVVEYFKNL